MSKSTFRPLLTILPVLAIMAAIITMAFAGDQPDTTEANLPSAGAVMSPPSANDSLFAVINTGFQALKPAFEKSCYDCHSKYTQFPWYYKLPVIKGMIDGDIKTARKNVDFSNGFPFTGRGSQADMLQDIKDEISGGDMPPFSYRMIHWGRQIEGASMESVVTWIDSSLMRLAGVGIKPTSPDEEE
jgi:hypothetical protein